jgi:hypothetical protein
MRAQTQSSPATQKVRVAKRFLARGMRDRGMVAFFTAPAVGSAGLHTPTDTWVQLQPLLHPDTCQLTGLTA